MSILNKSTKRRSKKFKKLTGKLWAERIHIDRQGYDRSGRYWGTGPKLYRVYTDDEYMIGHNYHTGEPKMAQIDQYERAPSAKVAKEKVYKDVFREDA
jgi:hypothetical protein